MKKNKLEKGTKKETMNLLVFIGILTFLAVITGLGLDSNIPFSKSYECKRLMQPLQNVTLGQGEMYSYKNGNCVLWYPSNYGYGDWIVSYERLKEMKNKEKFNLNPEIEEITNTSAYWNNSWNSSFITFNTTIQFRELTKEERLERCWEEKRQYYNETKGVCDTSIKGDCEFKNLKFKVLNLEAHYCEDQII